MTAKSRKTANIPTESDSAPIRDESIRPAAKPVSLAPLKFEEAVAQLLKVKPSSQNTRGD